MPNYTEKYNLEKPLASERYNIEVHNKNMNKIEAALVGKVDAVNSKTGNVVLTASDIEAIDNDVSLPTTVQQHLTDLQDGLLQMLMFIINDVLGDWNEEPVSEKVSKSGDTMTGNLIMDNSDVRVKTPSLEVGQSRNLGFRINNSEDTLTEIMLGAFYSNGILNKTYIGKGYLDTNLEFYDVYTRATKPIDEKFQVITLNSQQEFNDYVNNMHINSPNDYYYRRLLYFPNHIAVPGYQFHVLLEGSRATINRAFQRLTPVGAGLAEVDMVPLNAICKVWETGHHGLE